MSLAADLGGTQVASHVEAWIETLTWPRARLKQASPPMWRRGLKRVHRRTASPPADVASHVEAWIETLWP